MNAIQNQMQSLIRNLKPTLLAQHIVGVQTMPFPVYQAFSRINRINSVKSKYNFSRAKWYVATYNYLDGVEIGKWCAEQFGPHPTQADAWSRWCCENNLKIRFRDEQDYVWFILRWS